MSDMDVFEKSVDYQVEREEIQDGMMHIRLVREGDLRDEFLYPSELFGEMEENDWVFYFFYDLWWRQRRKFDDQDSDRFASQEDPDQQRLSDIRLRRYYIYKDHFLEEYQNGDLNVVEMSKEEFTEDITPEKIEETTGSTRIAYFDHDRHLLWPWDWDVPLAPCYYVNYIGGFQDDKFDLDEVRSTLEDRSDVLEISDVSVPHYNGGGEAVEFLIRPSQDLFERLVRHYRDEKEGEFWSVRVEEEFGSLGTNNLDVLDLASARKED